MTGDRRGGRPGQRGEETPLLFDGRRVEAANGALTIIRHDKEAGPRSVTLHDRLAAGR